MLNTVEPLPITERDWDVAEAEIIKLPVILASPVNGKGVDGTLVKFEPSPWNDPENEPDNPGDIKGVP